jgi:hypothetical protein
MNAGSTAADHSLSVTAKLKEWCYTSTSPIRLHVMHLDKFFFVLLYVYTFTGCAAEKGKCTGGRTRGFGELEKEMT